MVAFVPGAMLEGGLGTVKQEWPGSISLKGVGLATKVKSDWVLGSILVVDE